DYVKAMWMMLQQDDPRDYVIATGRSHSVKSFVDTAFGHVDLDYHDCVVTDPRFVRPAEVDRLLGDASLARKEMGWEPEVDFEGLVKMMVDADLERLREEKK
ncbi:MAG: GDP-mannose 4,6-dehydratase, partial [Candidatus Zixiibacteriota bacterium]